MSDRSSAFRSSLLHFGFLSLLLLIVSCGGSSSSTTAGSIQISGGSGSFSAGGTMQLTAIETDGFGRTSNVTSSATWTSANTAVATVNTTGVVTGNGAGSTSISAKVSKFTGTFNVTIGAPAVTRLALSPSNAAILPRATQAYVVTATYANATSGVLNSGVQWSVLPASVATISSSGVVAAVSPGSYVVVASVGSVNATISGTVIAPVLTTIAITPANASIASGKTQQFKATGNYSDGSTLDLSKSVAWTSSNTDLLTIDTAGLATASTAAASTPVTVTAQLGNSTSTVTAHVTPAATLTNLYVQPTSSSIVVGSAETHTALALYSDGSQKDVSRDVVWSVLPATNTREGNKKTSATSPHAANDSGDSVTVTQTGTDTAVVPGMSTLQASLGDMQSGSTVIVTNATVTKLDIRATKDLFPVGALQPVQLIGTFSDGSRQDLSLTANWQSSDTTVATIDDTGVATGLKAGPIQFTASFGGLTASTIGFQILPTTLVSTIINVDYPTSALGVSEQLQLLGTYSDGTIHDLTPLATWQSNDPSIFSVDSKGIVYALSAGTTQIIGTVFDTSAITSLTGADIPLLSMEVLPADGDGSLALGTTLDIVALGNFGNGNLVNVSEPSIWVSSDPSILTIDSTGRIKSGSVGQTTGTAQITAALNGVSFTTGDATVTPATLTTLTLSPALAQIAKGTTQQFNATGTYSDGTMQNLSSNVTWVSSDGTVASIKASGLATGTGVGTAQITAAYQGQAASTASLQVTPATLVSIAFSPSTPTVAVGTSAQVIVTGTFSDGTTQNLSSSSAYSSSNPASVNVSSNGIISGISAGSSTVTVNVDGLTSGFTATVTNASLVSIAITPSSPAAFANGTTQQFTATGTYSDGTTQNLSSMVSWTSSNTAVVIVDTNGLATGNGGGSASLTATYQGQTATTTNFQITPATVASIAISPSNSTISNGGLQQFIATATYTDGSTQNLSNAATWNSSNPNVAGISGTGLATAQSAGSTTISAQVGSANNSTTLTVTNAAAPTVVALTISPINASLTAANTLQYTATATLSDSSTMNVSSAVNWSSSAAAVSTISASGLATSVTAGTTTIAAQLGALASSTTLTVIAAPVTLQSIAITPTSASIAKGSTQQFTATGSYSNGSIQNLTSLVVWASSVSSVATINSSGLAVGSAAGNTQIWADYQGKSAAVTLTVGPAALVSISVTPQAVTLAAGTTQQYKAVGTMTDGGTQDLTTSVTWSSNNSGIATLNTSGLATSHTQGSATITAASGSVAATVAMTVTSATVTGIQLSPSPVSIPAGDTQQLLATANFTDGSSQNVTTSVAYATSAANVIRVNTAGLLTGVASGTATITATLGSVATVDNITVNSAVLTSITVTPADPSLPVGLSQQLAATGTFSDGSTQNLSSLATWTSSNPSIATVSATGNVTVAETGNSTITASSGTVTGDTTVTGTSAVITAISVSPASVTLAAGQTQQFAATATLSDSTQQTVTSSAHWSVSNPSKATVSNTSGTSGFLTSISAGATNVTATLNSISGSGAVTIQAASLTSIAITPNPVSLPAGTNQSLTVTGTYSDGSTANLTASATFGSASSSTAAVNSSGLVHGVTAGSTTITATVQGVSSTDSIAVTSALLTSIAVTPSSSSVALGLHSQLTATGTYTDGSTANISSSVAWSSSSPSTATVNSAGLVSTLATGSSTLTATLTSISGTASVTVTAAVLQSIAVTAPQNSFSLGLSLQLNAVGTYSDGTTQNLTSTTTWSSQTPTVGVVSSTGLATGHTTGTFNAVATTNGVSGSLIVTVTSAVLQSIVVTPANSILIQIGGAVQYTATGQFSDGTTQNLTTSVHWAISNGITLATINQSGQLSTVGVGVGGTVTATLGAISGSTGFTVIAL